MRTLDQPLSKRTAADVMSRDIVCLVENMPLREAARMLMGKHIGGAPVVDREGRCVGVLSSIDFLRLAESRVDMTKPATPPLPVTCSFQTKQHSKDGRDQILCTLASGACPIQVKQKGPNGEEVLVCSQPRSVLVDWQVVEMEKLPADEVRRYMTPNPITVAPETSVRTLARVMIESHIHRIIVVDDERHPVGVVSSTDLLALVAEVAES